MENQLKQKLVIFLLPAILLAFFPLISLHGQATGSNTSGIEINITKNSTPEQLESIKKQVENQGFHLSFDTVKYNQKDEITAITISYKDKNNNSGKYSVSSEDPINSIRIAASGNSISVQSTGEGNQVRINQDDYSEFTRAFEEMEQKMEEEKKEFERRMEKRRSDQQLLWEERKKQIEKEIEQRKSRTGNETGSAEPNLHQISKNTSERELLQISQHYQLKNISVSYANLKYNNLGEIVQISITVDNHSGSRISSSFGDGTNPISTIRLQIDSDQIILEN